MGKVKIRIVGDEAAEKEQKEEQKKRREGKKQTRGLNMGGGQRINAVGPSEEEVMKQVQTDEPTTGEQETENGQPKTDNRKPRGNKQKAKEARVKSKRYTENASLIALAKGQSASGGKSTAYPVLSGIEILRKFKKGNFDETVELHINVKEKGISGQVTLPHGTGKKLRIRIVDDATIAEVESGKIDFDVLVATPDMMPKLAKVAKTLGPRGLMPNPKNGTISENPSEVVEKLSKGQVSYKTEAVAPIIHASVGKLSFEDKQLTENITSLLASIGQERINNIVLKSTMSPAIKIAFA